MRTRIVPEVIDLLRSINTCAVSNAIKTFKVRMRDDGFIHDVVRYLFPDCPPVVGDCRNGSNPNGAAECGRLLLPADGLVGIRDRMTGVGAPFGEIHAPARVKEIVSGEAQLLTVIQSADFNAEKLADMLNLESPLCPPLHHT